MLHDHDNEVIVDHLKGFHFRFRCGESSLVCTYLVTSYFGPFHPSEANTMEEYNDQVNQIPP